MEAKYGGLEVSDAKRLKTLEDENTKLKKLLAEAMLDKCDAQGDRRKKMVTPAAKREAVAHLRSAFEVSERRACSVLRTDRTSVRYRSTRPDDAAIRTRVVPENSIRWDSRGETESAHHPMRWLRLSTCLRRL
jgi:putative transposase